MFFWFELFFVLPLRLVYHIFGLSFIFFNQIHWNSLTWILFTFFAFFTTIFPQFGLVWSKPRWPVFFLLLRDSSAFFNQFWPSSLFRSFHILFQKRHQYGIFSFFCQLLLTPVFFSAGSFWNRYLFTTTWELNPKMRKKGSATAWPLAQTGGKPNNTHNSKSPSMRWRSKNARAGTASNAAYSCCNFGSIPPVWRHPETLISEVSETNRESW